MPPSVTSIGGRAFHHCIGLTSVTMSSNVTAIGAWAFSYCTGLTDVTIPSSVMSIGGCAFQGCSSLTGVTIPEGVTSIGCCAFYYCSGLTNVTISSSVTSIGAASFGACAKLTAINVDANNKTYASQDGVLFDIGKTVLVQYPGDKDGAYAIPSSVTSIWRSAFSYCSGLTGVTIPSSVTSIGDGAFSRCSTLTSVTIPSGVTSIGGFVFSCCSALANITIPDSVTSIGDYAFSHCSALMSVEIPSSVTSIGNMAYYYCDGLTSVVIPSSVASIGDSAFGYCDKLTAINVDADNETYASQDGVLFDIGEKALVQYPGGKSGAYAIPSGVTSIGDCAFSRCSALTGVTIPSSVTSIGSSAFYDCRRLASVTIPSSVTSIGELAFYKWFGNSLNAVDFEGAPPEGVANASITTDAAIRYNAAYEAQWLPVIQQCGWTNATPYELLSEGGPYKESVDGITWTFMVDADLKASVGTEYDWAIPTSTKGAVTIPSILGGRSVTSVKSSAFALCTGLTSVTIPEGVTSIGSSAFAGCNGLTSVTIPSSVTSVGDHAFSGCEGLTSMTIPSSVTNIGEQAFWGCSGLTSVTIPLSVTSIGVASFGACAKLTAINVDAHSETYASQDGVLFDIGKTVLIQCPGGKESAYVIPPSVTSIGVRAFGSCSGLTSVTMPSSVTSIGEEAFWSCTGLTSVTIPSSVTSIGYYAFYGCTSLNAVDFEGAPPEGVANASVKADAAIRYNAAYEAQWLPVIQQCGWTNATPYELLPEGGPYKETVDGITWTFMVDADLKASVGTGSWSGTAVPTSTEGAVTIPSTLGGRTVTGIGGSAFSHCSGLTSVTIPEGVTRIGEWAFLCCSSLTSINVDANNKTYTSQDGVLFDIAKTVLVQCPGGKESAYVIPPSVTGIGERAFYLCSGLTSVTIPSSVTSIGYYAFYGCNGLTSVTIPSSVMHIRDYAFDHCTGLTSVLIQDGVMSIGEQAFYVCTDLTSVTIPSSVTNIGAASFGYCAKLTAINVDVNNETYASQDGVLFDIGKTILVECPGGKKGAYTIPLSVTSVGAEAFYCCSGLTSVTIPSSVTSIGNMAFNSCSGLTSVTIPSSVTSIGSAAFGWCTSLANMTIQDGVTSIGDCAFWLCTGLTSVTIPSSVTNIGERAFDSCDKLMSINIDVNNKTYASQDGVLFDIGKTVLIQCPGGKEGVYTIPSGVTSVRDYAFAHCIGLTSVIIPPSVKIIGDSAFSFCNGLTSVIIPPSVKIIGNMAFNSCSGLTSVAIPSSVTSIGKWAFSSCSNLNAVDFEGAPPEGVENASIKTDAAIRYNVAYKAQWEPIVEACGWTNATPYPFVPAMPVISPKNGTTFDKALTVSMTCASKDATIHYTTDGTTPTMESAAYSHKFKIYGKTTVKAIAFWEDGAPSEMAVAEYSKGWCATPEIVAQSPFTGSQQRVDIVCATEGATMRYTTNGDDPNSHSTKYTKPFYVTDTTMVKAYATKADYMNSGIATQVVTKVWGIGDTMGKPDHAFETSGNLGFVRAEDATATLGESMKSGAIDNNQKSILSTKVIGPGTLTFKWKASCEEDDEFEWDHAEFRVNGALKGRINGVTDWVEVSQRINGKGTNTVTWTYIKDDVEGAEQDCVWVADYVWESDYTETKTTEVPVPYDWLREKSRDIVDEYDNYEKVAKQKAYNQRYTVEQCYVVGLNPESTTNEFATAIEIIDGVPSVTWNPDLKGEREYRVWGSTNLVNSADWHCPTNALDRFFKVTVEMP